MPLEQQAHTVLSEIGMRTACRLNLVSHMDIFDLLTQPTTLIGCLLGFALAVVLHFLFPENNLTFLQAIIVAASTLIGMLIEYSSPRKKRNQK